MTLVLSRLLLSLEPYISGIRDAARHSVDTVFSEIKTRSPLSWRIDTDVQDEETSTLESKNIREMVLQWAENQSNPECQE